MMENANYFYSDCMALGDFIYEFLAKGRPIAELSRRTGISEEEIIAIVYGNDLVNKNKLNKLSKMLNKIC